MIHLKLLELVWSLVITATDKHDGVVAQKVVEPLLEYLDRMKKILADQAYKV